jgi:hypothetical protein
MKTKAYRQTRASSEIAWVWLIETAVPWILVATLAASCAVGVLTLIRDLRAGTPAPTLEQHPVCETCGRLLDGRGGPCVPEGAP